MQIKNINIPQACHQSWQQMEPVNQGRHCEHCCKIVTDFTKMTSDEILKHLSSNNNVCGRFNQQQLNGINQNLTNEYTTNDAWFKKAAIAIVLFGSTVFYKANAQVKPATHQTSVPNGGNTQNMLLGKVVMPDSLRLRTITGCVTDENNEKLPGATILQADGTRATQADINGDFSFQVPVSTRQLTVRFIGYNSKNFNIDGVENIYDIKLSVAPSLMGEVVIVKTPLIKRIYNKCIKRPIRKLFR